MTRLETFIDAAFAFAITMLVIATQQIPDDIETLLAAFKNVPAFVTSIIVLGIFWRGHWLWSRRYGLEDGVSIFISWAMIVTMLDRKSTRLNSSHLGISYAVFCLKKKIII